MNKNFTTSLVLLILPGLTLAFTAPSGSPADFKGFVNLFGYIVQLLLPIGLGLAFLLFLFNILKFVKAQGDGDKKTIETTKSTLTWGVLAIVVLFSIWGIVSALKVTFLDGLSNTPPSPKVQLPGQTS